MNLKDYLKDIKETEKKVDEIKNYINDDQKFNLFVLIHMVAGMMIVVMKEPDHNKITTKTVKSVNEMFIITRKDKEKFHLRDFVDRLVMFLSISLLSKELMFFAMKFKEYLDDYDVKEVKKNKH